MKKTILFLFVLVTISVASGVLKYGVSDGVKINAIAALTALQNRTPSNSIPEGIPVYELQIEEGEWELLVASLPKSGKVKKEALFLVNGKEYPVKLKLRGNLKLHWGGPKKSFRVYFDGDSPFGDVKQMNFVNPKTYQLTNNHMTSWIGDQMGVHTVKNEMVFVRINGVNYGVMEMVEQPTNRYEKIRDVSAKKVALYKGDYLEDEKGKAVAVKLWKDIDNWVYKSKKGEKQAKSILTSLITVLNSDSLTLKERWKGIEKHILVDEFIKFYACLTVLNTMHIDQTHNHVLALDKKGGRFYPILWDPTYMWTKNKDSYYDFYDPLSYYMLQNPKWREQRDVYVQQYVEGVYFSGGFEAYHDSLSNSIAEAVDLDYNKCNPVGNDMNMVYRFPNYLYTHSNKKILNTCKDYYTSVKKAIGFVSVESVELIVLICSL